MATSTLGATPIFTPLPTNTPSQAPPAAAPAPVPCVQLQGALDLTQTDYSEYPNTIGEFLNAGGTQAGLNAALDALGIANPPTAVTYRDLTGDGILDAAVSIIDPDSRSVIPSGILLLYICQGEQFVLQHTQVSEDTWGAPAIIHIQDLNADGQNELLLSSQSCGAHSCFEKLRILSWAQHTFESRFDEDTSELPFPNLQITDYDQDGVYDLEIVARGYGSIGAGPQRDLVRTYTYQQDNGLWQLEAESPGPSDFRIHTLHDADQASRRGDYPIALVLYDQVINDMALQDWVTPDQEQLNLSAYAHFKLVVVYALQGARQQAESTYQNMTILYPPALVQYAYEEMAVVFLSAFDLGGQPAGCQAAQEYATQRALQVLTPLGSSTFGYANPDYSPQDVCP